MTLRLTPDTLKATYDLLATTPPFSRWNLPDSDDILFRVTRHKDRYGHHRVLDGGRHEIVMSAHVIGHTMTLIETMAHEIVHVHQAEACMETKGQHNAAFRKLAAIVCRYHGFDAKRF